MGLRYKVVDWAPGYRVGIDGSIWSRLQYVGNVGPAILGKQWKKMSPYYRPKTGYCRVVLCVGGKRRYCYLANLILRVFRGEPPAGHQAAHGNGKAWDNRLVNLRWATRKDNCADKKIHGTNRSVYGETHPKAVLTDAQVLEIRKRRSNGERGVDLAKEYGVVQGAICNIHKRRTWKHLKDIKEAK